MLTYNPAEGSFTEVQYISTLPAAFDENNQGKCDSYFFLTVVLYMQVIVVIIVLLFFSVDENSGKLTFVAHTSTEGNWPRDFVLDPTGKFLVASNEKSA